MFGQKNQKQFPLTFGFVQGCRRRGHGRDSAVIMTGNIVQIEISHIPVLVRGLQWFRN